MAAPRKLSGKLALMQIGNRPNCVRAPNRKREAGLRLASLHFWEKTPSAIGDLPMPAPRPKATQSGFPVSASRVAGKTTSLNRIDAPTTFIPRALSSVAPLILHEHELDSENPHYPSRRWFRVNPRQAVTTGFRPGNNHNPEGESRRELRPVS
jgi:hypothetical protein